MGIVVFFTIVTFKKPQLRMKQLYIKARIPVPKKSDLIKEAKNSKKFHGPDQVEVAKEPNS